MTDANFVLTAFIFKSSNQSNIKLLHCRRRIRISLIARIMELTSDSFFITIKEVVSQSFAENTQSFTEVLLGQFNKRVMGYDATNFPFRNSKIELPTPIFKSSN
jgi:hypothetical protein